MADFTQSVQRGDALSALRMASVNGALWAIGSSWSNAIREIARVIVPLRASDDIVLAEILAAAVVTFIGLGISLLVTRNCWTPVRYLKSAVDACWNACWRGGEEDGAPMDTSKKANSLPHSTNNFEHLEQQFPPNVVVRVRTQ